MNVPSVIRTGFGLTDANASIDLERLANILSYFTEKAITIGVKYAHAAGRDILTSEDIKYALQYQAKHFLENIQNEEDLEIKLNSFSNESEGYESEDDEEDESEDDEEDEEEDEEEFTRAENADDPVICEMNRCHDEWDTWVPSNLMETLIKNAVDQTLM